MEEENQGESGQSHQRHQHGRKINHRRPLFSSVAALVQIVQNSNQTEWADCQVIPSGLAIDGRIRFVSGALKQDFALLTVHVEIGKGSLRPVRAAKKIDKLIFCHSTGVGVIHPGLIQCAVVHGRPLLAIEPFSVIQSESSQCEKKKNCETEHRQIGVQPPREVCEMPFPMQVPRVA